MTNSGSSSNCRVSCSNMISACLKANRVGRALYWYLHMTQAGIEGDGLLQRYLNTHAALQSLSCRMFWFSITPPSQCRLPSTLWLTCTSQGCYVTVLYWQNCQVRKVLDRPVDRELLCDILKCALSTPADDCSWCKQLSSTAATCSRHAWIPSRAWTLC